MALPFHAIPDWFSWENQGGNVALAELTGGQTDLFVFMIDAPDGAATRGVYRVGRNLTANGNVTGGWGPWIDVPNWFSTANQGCAIAVADVDGNGQLDLIVLMVDRRVPGPNRGIYQIGRNLNAAGIVTGGWSGWIDVPNWFSWENQGCAIAVTNLLVPGRKDLVVLAIDHRVPGPNRGIYQVGKDLGPDGHSRGGWGGWIDVDWFSWENQAAGLALADLDNDNRPELIVFQIDNPPQANAGQYRIGWKLDATGHVQDGWGRWNNIDGWNSWEDQGGGIALKPSGGGRPQLLVYHIDNPPGQNQGLYRVEPLQVDLDEASQKGLWRLLPYFSEVLPVHAALLHTGKVLFFAGSGNNAFRFQPAFLGNEAQQIFTSVVWDPASKVFDNTTFHAPPTLHRNDGSVVDFFCCGHAFLPDGRLLVAGGTGQYDKKIVNQQSQNTGHGFAGIRDVLIFNPVTSTWKFVAPMAHGRWYPTVIGLSDGSALVASGLNDKLTGQNNTLERNLDPDHAAWVKTRDFGLPLYPHLFQLHDGRIFFTGGKMDTDGDSFPFAFDPIHPTASDNVDGLTDVARCNQCASVILPPVQAQHCMILGGGPEDPEEENAPRGQATRRVAVVDFTAAQPKYQTKANLNHERMHVNAVLLPDRSVIAVGGGVTREASATKVVDPLGGREVFEAEIYDQAADKWTITAPATVARLYHSVALLLPDGRVLSAGGNPDKGSQTNWLPPDPLEEERLEIYSPPYLFRGKRPTITAFPAAIHYGQTIAIRSPEASSIKLISLIRPGLTTHSFNCEQRIVDVLFHLQLPDTLSGTVTTERTIAPPGWYMIFLTDHQGVPSVASWTQLS